MPRLESGALGRCTVRTRCVPPHRGRTCVHLVLGVEMQVVLWTESKGLSEPGMKYLDARRRH